jgi:hypothetical protein
MLLQIILKGTVPSRAFPLLPISWGSHEIEGLSGLPKAFRPPGCDGSCVPRLMLCMQQHSERCQSEHDYKFDSGLRVSSSYFPDRIAEVSPGRLLHLCCGSARNLPSLISAGKSDPGSFLRRLVCGFAENFSSQKIRMGDSVM